MPRFAPESAQLERKDGRLQALCPQLKQASSGGPYATQANAVAASLTSDATARRSSPPTLIADNIAKAVTAGRPRTRYAVGYGARPMIFLHGVLSDRAFDAFICRATGVPS